MTTKIIRKQQTKSTRWSGGTTTELYIYPEHSVFKELNFDFRISIATVEIEKSTFTSLPGVSRTLLVLKGDAILKHEGHHTAFLSELEQDSFEGDWQTTCTGTLTDFNLMTTHPTKGKVEKMELSGNTQISLKPEALMELFYLYQGEFKYEDTTLHSGDLLILRQENEKDDRFRLEGKTTGNCVFIRVKINQ